MRRGFAALILLAVVSISTDADAMGNGSCRVVEGAKYLASAGGGGAICAAIKRAISAQAPHARFSVEVKALSPSRLSASVVVNGHALPEHKFAVMDRDLGSDAVQRFARSLAEEVFKAAKA
jgi:hypothetical protein